MKRRTALVALAGGAAAMFGVAWVRGRIGEWEECPCEPVRDVTHSTSPGYRGLPTTVVTITFAHEFTGHVRVNTLAENGDVVESKIAVVQAQEETEVRIVGERPADVVVAISPE